jgi:hypothetical protein
LEVNLGYLVRSCLKKTTKQAQSLDAWTKAKLLAINKTWMLLFFLHLCSATLCRRNSLKSKGKLPAWHRPRNHSPWDTQSYVRSAEMTQSTQAAQLSYHSRLSASSLVCEPDSH